MSPPGIEAPTPLIVRGVCETAALHDGSRRRLGEQGGSADIACITAHGNIRLAGADIDRQRFVALDHAGVIAGLGAPAAVVLTLAPPALPLPYPADSRHVG